jgi:hypothetical protein
MADSVTQTVRQIDDQRIKARRGDQTGMAMVKIRPRTLMIKMEV